MRSLYEFTCMYILNAFLKFVRFLYQKNGFVFGLETAGVVGLC
jgi:hypothetical protein